MEKDLEAMKSHGVTRGRHSPPFLLIGLVVVIVILSVNYWYASTRLADLQQQDEELRQRYYEVLLTKNQLSAKNEILETKVKENVETYDTLRQIRDKKEEEGLICKETLEASKRYSEISKSEDEKKVIAAEEKLRKAELNITQQVQIHDQDGSVVASLREANAKLSAQLSALQESLNDTPPSIPLPLASASSTSSQSTKDCNQHCLVLVEAAQERLFKKIVDKFGQDALNVLESADFGIPRRPGKIMTGPPPLGKVPDDILVVGRDGKIISGAAPKSPSSDAEEDPDNLSKDASKLVPSTSFAPPPPDQPVLSPFILDKVIPNANTGNVGAAPNLNAAPNANAVPNPAYNVGAAPNLNAVPNVNAVPNAVNNVVAAPPNLRDDESVVKREAVAAAAVAPKPPQDLREESRRRDEAEDIEGDEGKKSAHPVDDIVDVEAEATDDEDDDDNADGAKDAAAAVPAAHQEPILDAEAPAAQSKDKGDADEVEDDGKDGIDQLNHNLATFDGEAGRAA